YRRNYKQAVQGFEKYVKLRGYKAFYSDSSLYYISKSQCLEKGYIEEKESCTMCNGQGHIRVKCHYCKGLGKEYCPICNGAGVVISKSNIGDNYQQCYKCNGTGITLCSHCQGTTFEEGDCPQCKGNGFVLIRKECK
ncbi:MAG TPA: molecular chaperone DnaJ, partial [Bacteroidia bacterium]|nr:molecular chaperone DnaJ [Bacteroidia bacterium]